MTGPGDLFFSFPTILVFRVALSPEDVYLRTAALEKRSGSQGLLEEPLDYNLAVSLSLLKEGSQL